MADDRIITALDVHSLEDMEHLVTLLGDSISFYKVGMELFYSVGPDAVRYLKSQGKHVFLDLKLHDIPNTVGQSLRALTRLGADLMTIHSCGGRDMMAAAAAAVADEAAKLNIKRPRLLAVTILTSIDETAWQEIGGKCNISDTVRGLAKMAKEAGIDGTVSSPYEAREIRAMNGSDFLIVTPGIRPSFAVANDQKRFTTPAQALTDGASHLVIGRPITQAADPVEAVRKITAEIRDIHY
ncbi:MAG: orotidine-5'-phosphate decarboxylase [Megasphaera sp.]|jgi:orotidine-5'-phosphate decarboxylase|nr:orotidine-5'-phosphate decarboxylase [Megasphaera sp.]MCI1247552.1 orotidine-5'-phosphate decarboxylase [Megasphaera sp.]